MQRRQFNHVLGLSTLGAGLVPVRLWAQVPSALGEADALAGIRAALGQGVGVALAQLGQPGGYLNHPKVRIPLPGPLEDAAGLLKLAGQGKRLDELVLAMNSAAEQAIPLAGAALKQAVASMTVRDAQRILTGGDDSVTRFFAEHTRGDLTAALLPHVRETTQRVQLANAYAAVAGKAAKFGVVKEADADLSGYVTGRALDGVYTLIGDEERKIRQNPAAAGTALLKKVFGGL